jgi:RNA polymerase sigma-70 factor (ECF subfamily)
MIKPSAELTDEQLMELIIQRDKLAFSLLYDRYSGKLMGYFMKMLWNNREQSEDLLQELFLKIARQPELFDVTRSFKAWVYTVANNLCKMEYRKAGRKGVSVSLDYAPELADKSAGITERIDKKAFTTKLKEVLQGIDEPHKSTFMLRYFEDLTYEEIAELTQTSVGALKSSYHHAVKKIEIYLGVL